MFSLHKFLRRSMFAAFALALTLSLCGLLTACATSTPTAIPTPTLTATASATGTPFPPAIPTVSPTATSQPTSTPTVTLTPTSSPVAAAVAYQTQAALAVSTWAAFQTQFAGTLTAEPTRVFPTSTRTPTLTPTPTILPLAAFRTLANFSFARIGDATLLYDINGMTVATIDAKTGALRWDAKHFDKLNALLVSPDGQKALTEFLKANEQNSIRFIAYPAADIDRKPQPPYAIILQPDPKKPESTNARIVQGYRGTQDYTWDWQAQRLAALYQGEILYWEIRS